MSLFQLPRKIADRIFALLLPRNIGSDPDALRRGRLVINVVLLILLVSILMVGKYSADGAVEIRNRILLCIAFQPWALVVYRFTGSHRAAGHTLCGAMWLLFFSISSLSGGLESPNLVANVSVAMMATMLCGSAGVVWLGVVYLTFVTQYFLTSRGIFVRQTLAAEAVVAMRLSELFATSTAIGLIAYLYETGKRKMLGALTHEKNQVAAAHADIRILLDSTGQGFLGLDPEGRVIGEHSATAERWLGRPELGEPLHVLLARHNPAFAVRFQVGWSAVVDRFLPLSVCIEQLPKRLVVGGMTLAFEYRTTTTPAGDLDKTIVVISDITAQVASERAETRQRDTFAMFTRLMKDRDGFVAFVEEAVALAQQIRRRTLPSEDLARAIHTLKGNAGVMDLSALGTLCHELEDELAENDGSLSEASVETLSEEVRLAEGLLAQFSAVQDPGAITLSRDEYRSLLGRLESGRIQGLADEVHLWRLPAVGRELQRLADRTAALATRLEKSDTRVRVDDGGIRLETSESWRTFWANLIHVVRNSIDHGIESAEEREAAGKPPAELSLATHLTSDELIVEVSDNGRGIDWLRVRERAAARGLPHGSPAELTEALFADGLSTRDDVSDVSGRGVGMAAVRQACHRLGGRVDVTSRRGRGTTMLFFFSRAGLKVGAPSGPPEAKHGPRGADSLFPRASRRPTKSVPPN